MTINSKQKGKRGELEVVRMLRLLGFPEARRTAQYCGNTGDAADVTGVPNFHLEVKRSEKIQMQKWLEQAQRDCRGREPIVVFRSNEEPWRVCLSAQTFFTMYSAYLEMEEKLNDYTRTGTADAGKAEALSVDQA